MEFSEGNCTTTPPAITDIPKVLVMTVVVIMVFVAIIGTLGNTLVICAVVGHKKLRSIHNIFIINLAAADLIVTVIIIPFAIVAAIKGAFLTEHDALCETVGFFVDLSCVTSMISIANIALDRYICICHKNVYQKIYNKLTVPFMVMSMWLYSFLVDLPNFDFVGWGAHGFDPKTLIVCSFSALKAGELGYIWFLFVFSWGVSFTIICFCYSRLFLFVRRSRKSLKQNRRISSSRKSSTGIKSADKRLLKVLAVIIILFVIMWAPFCLISLLYTYVEVPSWLYFLSGHLCVSNSSINFLVYAFNKDFREGYKLVLKKFTCDKEDTDGNARVCMTMMTNINTDSTSQGSHNKI
ncbi:melatonin receptor type 1B-A-like [Amphiura filiformis]|uniref:melatonin receptor type 1B-A-like n=1 Tax=Amphiura filiformis TaxID=82378 RepID=UPI003B216A99